MGALKIFGVPFFLDKFLRGVSMGALSEFLREP